MYLWKLETDREEHGSKEVTWKQSWRASSPCEFLRLEKPHRISLMSTVPSRLLSNRSKTRGARGSSDNMFIAFSTSSNSERVALSPFAHLCWEFANSQKKKIKCALRKFYEAFCLGVGYIFQNCHLWILSDGNVGKLTFSWSSFLIFPVHQERGHGILTESSTSLSSRTLWYSIHSLWLQPGTCAEHWNFEAEKRLPSPWGPASPSHRSPRGATESVSRPHCYIRGLKFWTSRMFLMTPLFAWN